MDVKVIKVNQKEASVAMAEAVRILQTGGVVVYPTETAYGLGANSLGGERVFGKIFSIKGRDYRKPLSILIKDKKMAERCAVFSPLARKIFRSFMPGPLTLVLPKKRVLPDSLTGGLLTVGLRVSSHPFVRDLLEKVDFPLTATSANLSGERNVYSYAEFQRQFSGQGFAERLRLVDAFFDAGGLSPVPPSTVLDLTVDPPRILRQGSISAQRIEAVLGRKINV